MSDNGSDVSAQWNKLLASIDTQGVTLQTTPSETGESDSSDVSAQWNRLLASINTPGIALRTTSLKVKDLSEISSVHSTMSDLLTTSPEPTLNSTEDKYHPSPVPSPVLVNQTGHSSSEEDSGDVQHAIGELNTELPQILCSGVMSWRVCTP
ncbi:hypothetical protein PILCRDRAFT_15698 [Piloderma croceum F 1598]|uniref:Uncharacterized protein n=1 Tax=Piloderma croceum (strain F 1598) TaxID=765440 RepID=A0A0C3EYR5_PILCF|nr:hypothetical protein PILCRDRAFT_15698 [Piloderma croceum F 1598]